MATEVSCRSKIPLQHLQMTLVTAAGMLAARDPLYSKTPEVALEGKQA